MTDFSLPRHAMNNDEADFDWDEDIGIEESNRKRENVRSYRKQIPPFVRMILLVVFFSFPLAIPAFLTEHYMQTETEWSPDPNVERSNERQRVREDTIVLLFAWLSLMACIIPLTNWGIDTISAVVIQLGSWFTSSELETMKSRMQIFVATIKYLKWLIITIKYLKWLIISC